MVPFEAQKTHSPNASIWMHFKQMSVTTVCSIVVPVVCTVTIWPVSETKSLLWPNM